ncbi:MAG: DUF4230 domain-containing protein [Baekduia sp.]
MLEGGREPLLVRVAVVAAAILAMVFLVSKLNPFSEETIDRSQPAVLKSIEDLGELKAASANLQVIVDVEKDVNNIPDWLKGERTLFVAAGSVDAVVDLSQIGKDDIDLSSDRKSVTLTLPRAKLTDARLDTKRSRVYDRDRGILDRVGDALGDGAGTDQEVYELGTRKLEESAAADPDILLRAEKNTKATLTSLLRGLGFEQVTIRFEGPDPPKL